MISQTIGDPIPAIVADITTPDGKMFVIMEENKSGRMNRIQIVLGKAGSSLSAWAFALEGVINVALKNRTDITEIIEQISGTSSDKIAFTSSKRIPIRSAPDGVAVALQRYLEHKANEIRGEEHVIFRAYI